MTIALPLAISDSPLLPPPQCHSEQSEESQLPQPKTRNPRLFPPSLSSDNGCPVSLAHHTAKDKIWVRQANAAACGSLLASNRRLRQHLHSLPPDSPEALAIQSFLQFGI